MRKFGIITLFFALMINIIGGCTPQEEYHNINENVTIADARVSKVDSHQGKFSWYKIWFEKDGKATEFEVDSNLYSDVEKILNTAKMVGKEKEIRFDIVTDGKKIISTTLSSNRK
ncbi:signal peptide-containing lipoprotein [Bacillus phage Kirov]|uniref:Signal peptide-containing lipoprotein n=1 Tax=Bacillus phage Kirov TaxID=2783539 RepID=A0A7S6RB85_9CAUD|nr:signal peptide-containing lipoprotein [Bacillus phage Kirov]QOV08354.1 signal peptide-containing lipoprotein [Bacillus phage Kirov]